MREICTSGLTRERARSGHWLISLSSRASLSTLLVVNCISTGLERWQEHEGQGDDDGGEECAQKELQWADAPVFKVRLQN